MLAAKNKLNVKINVLQINVDESSWPHICQYVNLHIALNGVNPCIKIMLNNERP